MGRAFATHSSGVEMTGTTYHAQTVPGSERAQIRARYSRRVEAASGCTLNLYKWPLVVPSKRNRRMDREKAAPIWCVSRTARALPGRSVHNVIVTDPVHSMSRSSKPNNATFSKPITHRY